MSTNNPAGFPDELLPLFEKAVTTEYASLTRAGQPITSPVTPYVGTDRRTLDVTTGLTYPIKAERARHNSKVSLSYSDPVGAGIPNAPIALVYGLATVRDSDLQGNTDRYVRETIHKAPAVLGPTPKFVLKGLNWYFARIWVCVTPVRILWWPKGDLNAMPNEWCAPHGTTAPKSDPAPTGAALGQWMEQPQDWREGAAYAVNKLGAPVITVVDDEGWPVPLRTLGAQLTTDGFALMLGKGMPLSPNGKAFLTFHTHPEVFTGQENVTFIGDISSEGTSAHFKVERRTGDWSLKGNMLTRTLGFLGKGRLLKPRLEAEAKRRGQPVPVVNVP